jgi:hypothetical protein
MFITLIEMFKMHNGNKIAEGQILRLPCEVRSAFFPDESFYQIVVDGAVNHHTIVGHVNSKSIIQNNGTKLVPALVMESLEKESARIFLPGELISDPNPVSVPRVWLGKFL